MLIQVIIVAFSAFASVRLILKYRKNSLKTGEFVFWLLLWAAAALVAILPETTSFLARALGVGRGVDLVIYISIIALFYAVFRIFVRLEKMEQDITRVIREIAVREAEKQGEQERKD